MRKNKIHYRLLRLAVIFLALSILVGAQSGQAKEADQEIIEEVDISEKERRKKIKEEIKAYKKSSKKEEKALKKEAKKEKEREVKKGERKNKKSVRSRKKEEKKETSESWLWIVHPDQFVAKKLTMDESFYLPQSSLSMNPGSVKNWHKRLTHHFGYQEGHNVLLHMEVFYHHKKYGVAYPSYAFQLNLEIPLKEFKKETRIDFQKIKGYVAWVHPDFPDGDLFLRLTKGHLYLWKVEEGEIKGRLDMKFDHPALEAPVHFYGKVRADRLTRSQYARQQNAIKSKLLAEMKKLDHIPIHRDRLRPRYEYKKRGEERWIKGRSTGLWQTKEQ